MIEGTNGIFEIKVKGNLVFSKKSTGRFPAPGESCALIGKMNDVHV